MVKDTILYRRKYFNVLPIPGDILNVFASSNVTNNNIIKEFDFSSLKEWQKYDLFIDKVKIEVIYSKELNFQVVDAALKYSEEKQDQNYIEFFNEYLDKLIHIYYVTPKELLKLSANKKLKLANINNKDVVLSYYGLYKNEIRIIVLIQAIRALESISKNLFEKILDAIIKILLQIKVFSIFNKSLRNFWADKKDIEQKLLNSILVGKRETDEYENKRQSDTFNFYKSRFDIQEYFTEIYFELIRKWYTLFFENIMKFYQQLDYTVYGGMVNILKIGKSDLSKEKWSLGTKIDKVQDLQQSLQSENIYLKFLVKKYLTILISLVVEISKAMGETEKIFEEYKNKIYNFWQTDFLSLITDREMKKKYIKEILYPIKNLLFKENFNRDDICNNPDFHNLVEIIRTTYYHLYNNVQDVMYIIKENITKELVDITIILQNHYLLNK